MTTLPLIVLLFGHWVADFVFQTDKQAKGKSSDNAILASHVALYGLVLLPFVTIALHWSVTAISVATFMVVNMGAHFVTDYFTSRLNKRLWAEERVHDFFTSVGFDQFLHAAVLLGSYSALLI